MPALIKEGRWASYSFILRVWVRVAIYAVCHDQYIVRIEPRHFTEYHEPLWGLESPALLAAAHASLASIGPGCLLGVACLLAGWFGSYPRIPDRSVMKGVWLVIGGAELVSLVVERAFYHLEAAPVRVTGFDTPFPYSLEHEYLPNADRVLGAIRATLEW